MLVRNSVLILIHIWALDNNQRLNRAKSVEINLRTTEKQAIRCDSTYSRTRIRTLRVDKALGVMISRKFSLMQHVNALPTRCAQTLFALRTLQQHGMPRIALRAVFQVIIVNKIIIYRLGVVVLRQLC